MKSEMSLNGIFPLTGNRSFYDRPLIVLVAFTQSGAPPHTILTLLLFTSRSRHRPGNLLSALYSFFSVFDVA
jgi:hypothetical protein